MSADELAPKRDGESRRRPDPIDASEASGIEAANAEVPSDPRQRLEDRYYRTYLSRLAMGKRIQARGKAWNAALVALSTAAAIASMALLREPEAYGSQGDLLFAMVGVLTLVASLVVANANYGVRAQEAFSAYRAIQKIAAKLEGMPNFKDRENHAATMGEIDRDYQYILDNSDNHSAADFFTGVPGRLKSKRHRCSGKTDHRHVSLHTWLSEQAIRVGSVVATLFPLVLVVAATLLTIPAIQAAIDG